MAAARRGGKSSTPTGPCVHPRRHTRCFSTSRATASISGMFAATISVRRPRPVFSFSPAYPSAAPARLWAKLSIVGSLQSLGDALGAVQARCVSSASRGGNVHLGSRHASHRLPRKINLSPVLNPAPYWSRPVQSRASSIAMLDDGAGPASLISDAEWSAGRRSGLRHWPRAPRKRRPPVTGISPWVRLAGRKVRPAGLVSLLLKGGDPPWRLPALHPLIGEKEKGKDGRRTSLNNRRAERWLDASHSCAKQAQRECGGTRGRQDDESAGAEASTARSTSCRWSPTTRCRRRPKATW